jgi:hypothetical protein
MERFGRRFTAGFLLVNAVHRNDPPLALPPRTWE